MNKSLKNIPKEFLINSKYKNNEPDFYITSTQIQKTQKTDTIWLLLAFLIILDIL